MNRVDSLKATALPSLGMHAAIDRALPAALLTLYESARTAPLLQFELAASRQLGRLIGFDGAVWGQGKRQANAGPLHIEHASLFDRPPQLLSDYATVAEHDPVTETFLRAPCRVQVIDVARNYVTPHVQPVRDYLLANDVGHLMLLGGGRVDAGSTGALSWMTAYRSPRERPFNTDDGILLQALLPHWLCAREICVAIRGETRSGRPQPSAPPPGTQPDSPPCLTVREAEVLNLVARGFTYTESARHLGVSVSTVRTHARHLYEKLDAHNKTEAVYEARQLGLL